MAFKVSEVSSGEIQRRDSGTGQRWEEGEGGVTVMEGILPGDSGCASEQRE